MIKDRPTATEQLDKNQIIEALKKQLAEEQRAHQHDQKCNKALIAFILEKGLTTNEQLTNLLRSTTAPSQTLQESSQIKKDSDQRTSETPSELSGVLSHSKRSHTQVRKDDREATTRLSGSVEADQRYTELTRSQAIVRITELEKSLQKQCAYENMVNQIATNTNMTYSDRVLWIIVLNNHPEEMIECKPFQPNISRLRQESGVSPDSATKFFTSMQEAKGIKYSNKAQQDENHTFTSVSTITPLPNHSKANTRAATLRIKQRTETTKRRMARKLIIQPCEECGSDSLDHAYSAIIPICRNCNHVTMNQQETILAKNVRIIEEEIIPPNPSHEFSEVTDHEWEEISDDDVSASCTQEQITEAPGHEFSETQPTRPPEASDPIPTSHEFSDTPNGNSEASTKKPTPPSHELSKGMTVSTPHGIGVISIISTINNKQWCRVHYPVIQPDGTFYRPFELHQIQPIIQSTLEERS